MKPVGRGQSLQITAAEWNRILTAVDAVERGKLSATSGANAIHARGAATVRVQNLQDDSVPIGGVVGFEQSLIDPLTDNATLARFCRDEIITVKQANRQDHMAGRWGVTIQPLEANAVGRVVFDGIVAAKVNVKARWHRCVDVADEPSFVLQSRPTGAGQILWLRDPDQLGEQWAIIRIGNGTLPIYLAKILPGGIPPRDELTSGTAKCELAMLRDDGEIFPIMEASDQPVEIDVYNTSRQKIRGPVRTDAETIFRLVRPDGKDGWAIDPPTQCLLCRPTSRIRAKSWGAARELRWNASQWKVTGNVVEVYNATDQTMLPSQHVVAHFHEDAAAYIGVSARCCDESSSSSSESSSSGDSKSSSASSSSSSSSSKSSSSNSSSSSSSSNSSSSSSSSSDSSSSSSSDSSSSSSNSSGSSSQSSNSSESSKSSDSKSESKSESESESDSRSESESESESESDSESRSDSESESDESNSDESDDSRSDDSEDSADSEGSDHESDKSTAIVPASFTPGGFTALFTLEAPEVRFDDVFRVQTQGLVSTVAADPRFVEVCQRGTLAVDSVVCSRLTRTAASIDDDGIVRIEVEDEFDPPALLTVRITGIRRGFCGKRFPNRTREQFEANERFLQSAYPGAGQ